MLKYILPHLGFVCFVCSFVCEDDLYRDCKRRVAMGGCEGMGVADDPLQYARQTLAECRKSCRTLYYENNTHLPDTVKLYGGVEDYVVDPFGFQYPLCPQNGGFTSQGRVDVLFQQGLISSQPAWVPMFTSVGFHKSDIPSQVSRILLAEYERALPGMVQEECIQAVINCQEVQDMGQESRVRNRRRTFMIQLSEEVLSAVRDTLHPLAEDWSGVRLEHTATYGVRRYTNGSWLASHLDRFSTHVISAILNLGQSVTHAWPLHILDNSGAQHSVLLQPGEMLWYESARLVHGRPDKLEGEYFDNIFIHYRPTDLWYDTQYQIGSQPREQPITLQQIKEAQHKATQGVQD